MKSLRLFFIATWGLISWAAVQLIVFAPIFLLGLVLVPALLRWAPIKAVPSRLNQGQQIDAYAWAWADELYGNHEDGLCPTWWLARGGTRWTWFLRNPVSNMRFWPLISTRPDPARVQFIGSPTIPPDGTPCLFLAWQGPFVGFRWQGTKSGVWLGWAVNPSDRLGMPNDWRAFGFSVVLQILNF